MKLFTAFLLGLFLSLASPAFSATLSDNNIAEFQINRVNAETAFKHRLGRAIFKNQYRVLKCTYDFAKVGGAVSSINLQNEDGQKCIVPNKAIILQVIIDVLTAGTTSASGTMALTAQSAGDLKAALAAASYTGLVAGIPVGTAATAIKMTADRTVIGTIATGALTAGKWNVLIQYMISE